ncbi:hypothetical protein KZ829_23500 [Actinoplanes hulinensis]|uniref:Uncharacterized protein n=1 Tax=Actinoplanes hulinensis TaxID=1144547 RepID=A0ABS7B6P7_9ACTN|nr:hypothetical protein [Actinoplanes hulinensis]MBW6436712.1 hypothetical protein [Actinoplanes hulinensis]
MQKSSRRKVIGGNGRGQSVTVVEAPVLQTQRRKALITFWVTLTVTGLLGGTVASHYMHPILGILTGIASGFVLGILLGFLVLAWPVIRMVWWWLPEVLIGAFLVYGWVLLMTSTPLWLSLVVVVALAASALARVIRFGVMSVFWCLAVRHRLRMCFAAFIAKNRQGTLPFILLARPTPAGERVWVWLRPGLALHDLEQEGQLQRLAVGCWANEVRVTRASRKYAALIRLDITRRDTLKDTVLSSLPDFVPDDMPANAPVSPAGPPVGVNLNDVPVRPRRSPDDNEPRSRRGRQPEPSPSDDIDPNDYA